MAAGTLANASTTGALPALNPPSLQGTQPNSKSAQSDPDSSRRRSLPLHFLPPNLWSANASRASLVESEEAAHGEHFLDEATVAHRISALRQLNGATSSRHQYAKSVGARNSTFSQPVVVRTYSGAARPRSKQRDLVTVSRASRLSATGSGKMELKMPPVEAFTFKGIMDEIKPGVAEDLERIAEICARSRYSLSNQYEVHMPPHGRGDPVLQTIGVGSGPNTVAGGPTLQAIASEDEQPRHTGRRGGRRPKSMTHGTLETIMSSSRSSDEDKSRKKPAAVIAGEIRGRAAEPGLQPTTEDKSMRNAIEAGPALTQPSKHARSKSASFASMVIDNAQGSRQDPATHLMSPIPLISEPSRPQTSTTTDPERTPVFGRGQYVSPVVQQVPSLNPSLTRIESIASTLKPEAEGKPSILGSLGSWLQWSSGSSPLNNVLQGKNKSHSHAEGSLRDLLKSAKVDVKGKRVVRSK